MQLLVIGLPFAVAIFISLFKGIFSPERFRVSRWLDVFLPTAALAVSTYFLWLPEAGTNDGAFFFSRIAQIFLSVLFSLTALGLLAAFSTGNLRSTRLSPVALGVCGTINAALYVENVFIVTLAFIGAEFISIVAVIDVGTGDDEKFVRTIKSAVRYLIATVLFGLLLFVAQVFLERLRLDPQQSGLIKVTVALAIIGFALRLGVFPFNLWVPQVIEDAPALASYLVLGVINVAAVVFLVDFLLKNPSLLSNNPAEAQIIMALGMGGAIAAGLFALGQNGFGKMLAYTASGDLSLMLFGIASPHTTGLLGALFEAANFALLQLLIFTSLSVVYYCNNGRQINGLTGLGRQVPVAAIGLTVGFLGMAGVPLMSGFVGKYLILQSAAQEGLIWALGGGLALTLFIVAYLRYFHNIFMGRSVAGLRLKPEPFLSSALILVLVVVVIFLGCWPTFPLDWLSNAIRI